MPGKTVNQENKNLVAILPYFDYKLSMKMQPKPLLIKIVMPIIIKMQEDWPLLHKIQD